MPCRAAIDNNNAHAHTEARCLLANDSAFSLRPKVHLTKSTSNQKMLTSYLQGVSRLSFKVRYQAKTHTLKQLRVCSPVVHEEKLEFLHVVDKELVEAVGKEVTGALVGS